MEEGLKEGLHGANTLSSRLPTRVRVSSYHGPKQRNRAMKERNMMQVSPITNSVRNLQFRRPQERGFRKRNGYPKGRRQSIEALKEDGDLLKGPSNSEVINVCRDSKVVEVTGGFLKDRLQA